MTFSFSLSGHSTDYSLGRGKSSPTPLLGELRGKYFFPSPSWDEDAPLRPTRHEQVSCFIKVPLKILRIHLKSARRDRAANREWKQSFQSSCYALFRWESKVESLPVTDCSKVGASEENEVGSLLRLHRLHMSFLLINATSYEQNSLRINHYYRITDSKTKTKSSNIRDSSSIDAFRSANRKIFELSCLVDDQALEFMKLSQITRSSFSHHSSVWPPLSKHFMINATRASLKNLQN